MISSTSNPSQIATLAIASAAVSLYGCGSVTNDIKAMVQQQAAFAKEQMTDDESTSRMSPEQFMPNANEQPQPAQACRNMDPASAPHTAGAPRAATIACGSQAGEVNSAYATIAASTQSLGSHREFLPIHPDSCSTAIPTEVMSTGN